MQYIINFIHIRGFCFKNMSMCFTSESVRKKANQIDLCSNFYLSNTQWQNFKKLADYFRVCSTLQQVHNLYYFFSHVSFLQTVWLQWP